MLNDLRVIAGTSWRSGLLNGVRPRGGVRLARAMIGGRRDFYVVLGTYAADRPHAPAFTDEVRTLTWREVHDLAGRIATHLAALGVGRRDRVALVAWNRVEFPAAMAAIFRLGAIPAPISPHTPGPELARRLRESNVKAAICEPHLAGIATASCATIALPAMPGAEPAADGVPWTESLYQARWRDRWRPRPFGTGDPDMLLFTSGTTGRSKAARMQTRQARFATVFELLAAFDIGRDTVLFTPCPLYHAAPVLLTGLVTLAGGHVVVRRRLDAAAVDALAKSTHAFLVPTLIERLASNGELDRLRGSELRALVSGGAALRPALKTSVLRRLGPVLYDFYGATEMGVVSVATPRDLATAPASVGRLLPGVEARLVDDDGNEVGPREAGELFVRSDTTSGGYEGDDATSAGDGWVSAGDVARIEDGLLYIVDRKKDLIISGGVNLFPTEIEEVIEGHPTVREVAVVGLPDVEWGEAVHAVVVLASGCDLDEAALLAMCRRDLAPAQVPKGFHVAEALPRNPTGKLLRRELVARLSQSAQ